MDTAFLMPPKVNIRHSFRQSRETQGRTNVMGLSPNLVMFRPTKDRGSSALDRAVSESDSPAFGSGGSSQTGSVLNMREGQTMGVMVRVLLEGFAVSKRVVGTHINAFSASPGFFFCLTSFCSLHS